MPEDSREEATTPLGWGESLSEIYREQESLILQKKLRQKRKLQLLND